MGLDMYLTANRFVWHDNKELANAINQAVPCPLSTRPNYVTYEVAYWRKANHIHKWFVDNVQNGNDDCDNYYVNKKQLEELKDICDEVLKTAKLEKPGKQLSYLEIGEDGKATEKREDIEIISNADEIEKLLPTETGFFFGSTEYDKYYLEDVKYTKEVLDRILAADTEDWDFEYHSSW